MCTDCLWSSDCPFCGTEGDAQPKDGRRLCCEVPEPPVVKEPPKRNTRSKKNG